MIRKTNTFILFVFWKSIIINTIIPWLSLHLNLFFFFLNKYIHRFKKKSMAVKNDNNDLTSEALEIKSFIRLHRNLSKMSLYFFVNKINVLYSYIKKKKKIRRINTIFCSFIYNNMNNIRHKNKWSSTYINDNRTILKWLFQFETRVRASIVMRIVIIL